MVRIRSDPVVLARNSSLSTSRTQQGLIESYSQSLLSIHQNIHIDRLTVIMMIQLTATVTPIIDYSIPGMQRGKLNWAAQNALVQACGHGSKVGSMAPGHWLRWVMVLGAKFLWNSPVTGQVWCPKTLCFLN